MRGIRRVLRLSFFRRKDVVEEVDEELAFHLAMREAKLRASGLSEAEAARRARTVFGNLNAIRDDCVRESERLARKERAMQWVEDAAQDARFTVRSLLRAKGFAAAVILTLALGIGANAMIFALTNAIVLRPVTGVRDVSQVFELTDGVSYPVMRGLQEALPRLSLAGLSEREMAIGSGTSVDPVAGAMVTGNFFAMTGVRTIVGRSLNEADDVPGAPGVAVLSHGYWTRALGQDPAVVGRSITVNGAALTVVGVTAPEFKGLHLSVPPTLWVAMNAWPLIRPSAMRNAELSERGWEWVTIVGRLPAGMTLAQAHSAASTAWRSIDPESKLQDIVNRSTPRPAQAAALPGGARAAVVRFSAILLGVVALVLLTACANIAGLLLSRAAYRQREIAVRVALGAGRWRLARQLLTETMVLAIAGGAAGIAFFIGARALLSRVTLPGGVPASTLGLALDNRLLAFAALITLLTGILVGIAPALQAARDSTMAAIKQGSRPSRGQPTLRGVLVSAQVAVALVLLVGTGLFARALARALSVELGFDPERVVAVIAGTSLVQFEPEATAAYLTEASRRARTVPGVSAVSWSSTVPLTSSYDRQTAQVEGYSPAPDERVRFEYVGVGPRYLEVMGIPLISGRDFEVRDLAPGMLKTVINETGAGRYFKGRSPIGAHITMGRRTAEVIGVARDVKYHALNEEPRPHLYFAQSVVGGPIFVVRTEGPPASVLRPVEEAVRSANRAVPVMMMGALDGRLRTVLAPQLGGAWLLGSFGLLALLVAIVGIYGVVAYAVAQRTREIGIRMAIGARPGQVVAAVVGSNLGFVAFGVIAGLALSVMLARAASSFLFGVKPGDPLTLIATAALMLVVSLAAAYIPARRAVRVDPLLALRSDG
jgi:predicted permease